MNWLFRLGYKRPLEVNDLGSLPARHRAQHLYEIFKEDFQREIVSNCSFLLLDVNWLFYWIVYKNMILSFLVS